MYKLYNPETKRVIISIDIKWSEWENNVPEETINMFRNLNENYIVRYIEEVIDQYITPMSDPEDPIPVHVIPDEG